jgi:hypothetical protein
MGLLQATFGCIWQTSKSIAAFCQIQWEQTKKSAARHMQLFSEIQSRICGMEKRNNEGLCMSYFDRGACPDGSVCQEWYGYSL